jgi:2-polyprenyl-3-methyl-5-hydroxy-6-metoxy-1,4-benzoquinol methylase
MSAAEPAIVARIAARYRHYPHRTYVRGKLRWDPVFAAAAPLLLASQQPLLDVGCGLGLFGHYLRERGFRAPYRGVDLDTRKIDAATSAANGDGLDLDFAIGSANELPAFRGDVALLDVLHYLPEGQQEHALLEAAACVPAHGLLMIRNVLREDSWRFHATVAEERLASALRWMRFPAAYYPEREEIEAPLRARGFETDVSPLWGHTPFNSYLIVARRKAASP